MSYFRQATKQAVLEILEENAKPGRFGLRLDEDSIDVFCESMVDFIEMALKIRAKVPPGISASPTPTPKRKTQPQNEVKDKKEFRGSHHRAARSIQNDEMYTRRTLDIEPENHQAEGVRFSDTSIPISVGLKRLKAVPISSKDKVHTQKDLS